METQIKQQEVTETKSTEEVEKTFIEKWGSDPFDTSELCERCKPFGYCLVDDNCN